MTYIQPLQDNLQITEDDLQTEEDLDIMEDDQNLLFPIFLSINN